MGTWKRLADLPEALSHSGGAIVNGKFYHIGRSGHKAGDPCYAYDIASDTWSKISSVLHYSSSSSCFASGGKIYSLLNQSFGKSCVYNTATNTWAELTSGTESFFGSSCHVMGNNAYILSTNAGTSAYPKIFRYEVSSNKWIYETDNMAFSEFGAASIGDKIYCMGGRKSPDRTMTLETHIYDTKTKTWSRGPDMPETRAQHSCITIGDSIYCFGGYDQEDKGWGGGIPEIYPKTMLILDTKTGTWRTDKNIPQFTFREPYDVYNGKIYVAGGLTRDEDGQNQRPTDHTYVYDPNGIPDPDPDPDPKPDPDPDPDPDPTPGDGCGSCAKVDIRISGCTGNDFIKDLCDLVKQSNCDCTCHCEETCH